MFWFRFEHLLYAEQNVIHAGAVCDVYGNVYGNCNLVSGWLEM